jgi:hypothetical protein
MSNEQKQINVGDKVNAIVWAWAEWEQPTAENFHKGEVTEKIERRENSFYVRIEGIDKLIPLDRVSAI